MGLNEELWEAAECNQIDLVFTCGVYTCVQTFVLGWLRYAVCGMCGMRSGFRARSDVCRALLSVCRALLNVALCNV